MADYLQPGGARYKINNAEKQEFLFKVKNLDKQIIANCILDAILKPNDYMRTCVFFIRFLYSEIESNNIYGNFDR